MEEQDTIQKAISVLPPRLRRQIWGLSRPTLERMEEVRLHVGRPMSVLTDGTELELTGSPVTGIELEQLLELASGASLHTVLSQLRQGFITIEGGHRLGLCGRVVMRDGELINLRPLSSAALRIARQVRGAADPVIGPLCPDGVLVNTLILAPPGAGKTTLLRDLIRQVSDGRGCRPRRVALADERGEVAALWNGVPQLDVGRRTDVLEGCSKARGLMLLLRAMGPQVLAVDEITAREDVDAMLTAVGCGVTLLATAHGQDRGDLERRSLYRPLLEERIFRRLVYIEGGKTDRAYRVEVLE